MTINEIRWIENAQERAEGGSDMNPETMPALSFTRRGGFEEFKMAIEIVGTSNANEFRGFQPRSLKMIDVTSKHGSITYTVDPWGPWDSSMTRPADWSKLPP